MLTKWLESSQFAAQVRRQLANSVGQAPSGALNSNNNQRSSANRTSRPGASWPAGVTTRGKWGHARRSNEQQQQASGSGSSSTTTVSPAASAQASKLSLGQQQRATVARRAHQSTGGANQKVGTTNQLCAHSAHVEAPTGSSSLQNLPCPLCPLNNQQIICIVVAPAEQMTTTTTTTTTLTDRQGARGALISVRDRGQLFDLAPPAQLELEPSAPVALEASRANEATGLELASERRLAFVEQEQLLVLETSSGWRPVQLLAPLRDFRQSIAKFSVQTAADRRRLIGSLKQLHSDEVGAKQRGAAWRPLAGRKRPAAGARGLSSNSVLEEAGEFGAGESGEDEEAPEEDQEEEQDDEEEEEEEVGDDDDDEEEEEDDDDDEDQDQDGGQEEEKKRAGELEGQMERRQEDKQVAGRDARGRDEKGKSLELAGARRREAPAISGRPTDDSDASTDEPNSIARPSGGPLKVRLARGSQLSRPDCFVYSY